MATNTNAIPRVTDATMQTEVQALAMSILTTRWNPQMEALVPLSGLDELDRITEPVKLYNRGVAKYLLVGRAVFDEVNFHKFDLPGLQKFCGLTRTEGVITTDTLTNTGNQIGWVMDRVMEYNIRSIALFTSPYHITRAFATAIQAMEKRRMAWIPIVPYSVGELDRPVPELVKKGLDATGHDMVAGETQRYLDYVSDVAPYAKVREYMAWMRRQHPEAYLP